MCPPIISTLFGKYSLSSKKTSVTEAFLICRCSAFTWNATRSGSPRCPARRNIKPNHLACHGRTLQVIISESPPPGADRPPPASSAVDQLSSSVPPTSAPPKAAIFQPAADVKCAFGHHPSVRTDSYATTVIWRTSRLAFAFCAALRCFRYLRGSCP